ncbi:MAG: DMT family transporter, partial [Promethearchaeota archaeon]
MTKEKLVNSSDSTNSSISLIFLILTTILWGSTFIITKNMTQTVPIFIYLGLRFLIALIGFAPFLYRLKEINKNIVLFGFIAGFLYFLAIVFQTYGLQTTSAGKAGFITGLSTIIVPFIVWILYKKPLDKKIWLAVCLSIIGMAFLMLEGESGIIIGDILVLICAFFCALFIIMNDKYVRIVDVYLYSIVQLLVITILCFLFSFLINEDYDLYSANIGFWLIMIYMGLIVTTLTFFFQNWSQKHIEPSKTAIIFTLEPVFAVLFASWIIGSEILSWLGWLGCGLIFIAILITVIKSGSSLEVSDETD